MHGPPAPTAPRRVPWVLLCCLFVVVGGAIALAGRRPPPSHGLTERLLVVDEGALRYTFDTVTGRETLHDRSGGPGAVRDISATGAEHLPRLRASLLREHGAKKLEHLRAPDEVIERLKALGYL